MKIFVEFLKDKKKGFTLIELLLVIPLIVIALTVAYNIIFMAQKSFNVVNKNFDIYEEIRLFQSNLQYEASMAKKATTNKGAIDKSGNSLHVYVDMDDDNMPELIRYRLVGNDIVRDIQKKKSNSKEYPFEFGNDWNDEKIVLSAVKEFNIKEVKQLSDNDDANIAKGKDFRARATIEFILLDRDKKYTFLINSKSRASFEE